MPPERVIIEVKRIASAAGWKQSLFLGATESTDSHDPEQMVRDIVTVCIERYFS